MKNISLLLVLLFTASAQAAVTWSGDVTPNDPETYWTYNSWCRIGSTAYGTVTVTGSSDLPSGYASIGCYGTSSSGVFSIDGIGSTWTITNYLHVGSEGSGTLNITGGGRVTVGIGSSPGFEIDRNGGGDSFVNMATGGKLRLRDENWQQGNDLNDFLALVGGSGTIRFWNSDLLNPGWDNIANATEGVDYTLDHEDWPEPDGRSFTTLTVSTPVPEPATLAILGLGVGGLMMRRKELEVRK